MSKTAVLKAVREKCMDCTCDQPLEIQLCPMENRWALWRYRFGKDEDAKRELTPEQKAAYAERARKNFKLS